MEEDEVNSVLKGPGWEVSLCKSPETHGARTGLVFATVRHQRKRLELYLFLDYTRRDWVTKDAWRQCKS